MTASESVTWTLNVSPRGTTTFGLASTSVKARSGAAVARNAAAREETKSGWRILMVFSLRGKARPHRAPCPRFSVDPERQRMARARPCSSICEGAHEEEVRVDLERRTVVGEDGTGRVERHRPHFRCELPTQLRHVVGHGVA